MWVLNSSVINNSRNALLRASIYTWVRAVCVCVMHGFVGCGCLCSLAYGLWGEGEIASKIRQLITSNYVDNRDGGGGGGESDNDGGGEIGNGDNGDNDDE